MSSQITTSSTSATNLILAEAYDQYKLLFISLACTVKANLKVRCGEFPNETKAELEALKLAWKRPYPSSISTIRQASGKAEQSPVSSRL